MVDPVPGSSVPASEDHVIMDTPQGKTIIVFDGDMDKVLAAFVIANGALAMGRPVTMFFTFWGLTALRKPTSSGIKKTPVEAMFGKMLPKGTGELKLSRMNMGGLGTAMMRRIMQDKNIDSLEDMIGAELLHTEHTTPESYELHKLFREMLDAGCTHVVMEGEMQKSRM